MFLSVLCRLAVHFFNSCFSRGEFLLAKTQHQACPETKLDIYIAQLFKALGKSPEFPDSFLRKFCIRSIAATLALRPDQAKISPGCLVDPAHLIHHHRPCTLSHKAKGHGGTHKTAADHTNITLQLLPRGTHCTLAAEYK